MYGTVLRAMRILSEQEAAVTLAHGQDPNSIGVIRLDNVQNYLLQRRPGIGRESKLNIGLAATYYEVEDVDPAVFDLEDKRQRLAEKKRKDLTVNQLLGFVDSQHIESICVLQWINTLVQHIPQLSHLKPHISMLY